MLLRPANTRGMSHMSVCHGCVLFEVKLWGTTVQKQRRKGSGTASQKQDLAQKSSGSKLGRADSRFSPSFSQAGAGWGLHAVQRREGRRGETINKLWAKCAVPRYLGTSGKLLSGTVQSRYLGTYFGRGNRVPAGHRCHQLKTHGKKH